MNIQNKYTSLGKSIISGALCAGILSASISVNASTQQEISQVPLNLSEGVPPNIIVTIDESTSMDRAYVPDGLGFTGERRFRSNSFNAMYYNPKITYKTPSSFNKDGSEKILSTSFNKAYLNSFQPRNNEFTDLSTSYDVVTDVHIRDSATTKSSPSTRNPEYDFRCGIKTARLTKNDQTHTCTGDPQNGYSAWNADELDSWQTRSGKITITRGSKADSCTAVMEHQGITISAPCEKKAIKQVHTGITSSRNCTNKGDTFFYENNRCNEYYDETKSDYYIADLTKTSVPAYYYVADKNFGATAGNGNNSLSADGSEGNADCKAYESCYRLVFVTATSGQLREDDSASGSDERQNFANWYSFYRTRSLATISAASLAFYNLSPSSRVTWQNLSDCTKPNDPNNVSPYDKKKRCGNNLFREFSAKQRGEFYFWMQNMRMNNSTPLRAAMDRAGKFLKTDAAAWHKYPNDTSKTNNTDNTYACRASYHVLMTDGVWNGSDASDIGKTYNDDTAINLMPGTGYTGTRPSQYTPATPFQGGGNNSLADVAMNYWAMDLNSSLDNKVKPYMPFKSGNDIDDYWDPRNNPADWQHMVNFVMGLGLTNSLNDTNIPWEGGTYLGEGYKKLKSGAAVWPTVGTSSANVYDLWHAAINSRGEFFSVDSPDAMVAAFDSILNRIANRKSSAAKPGTSTSVESDGDPLDPADRLASYFYQTTFDSSSGWSGDVQKVKKYRRWNPVDEKFEDVVEEGWSAKAAMPAYTARNIMIANGAASLQKFVVGNAGLPSTVGTLAYWLNFNPDPSAQVATWTDRLEYIKGNRSKEGEDDGDLRVRTSILGDFLSSQPAVVTGARYLEGFANRLEGAPDAKAYTAYMAAIANRRGQLYIGGNSGMLHAFDAATGVEKFAFIPTAVFPKLNKLTGKNYTHEYYVDGTPVVSDVYDSELSKWRTILVGTLRAGGKGLFALDITNPDEITLLWQLDGSSDVKGTVKPGYSFPQPTVARLHNGKWAVVTGNGYKAEGANSGAAALYVIDAITGEMITNLTVQSASETPNGLSSPRLADYDSDGIADYAYAGDLHGNLWRFDLLGDGATGPTLTPPSNGTYGSKSGTTGKFEVSYGGKPMFTATSTVGDNAQPITSAPNLVRHPTRKGYLVVFGTGRYVEIGDKTGEKSFAQSLYGIWDQSTKAEATSEAGADIPRSSLAVQTITNETTGTGQQSGKVRDARIMSNNAIEWYKDFDSSKAVVKRGWRLDLQVGTKREGEMMIENMRTLGSMLILQTLVPNDDPCANGSTSWLYAINPATGGRTVHHAFDTQAADKGIVSAIKFGSEGGVSISQNEKGFTANAPGDEEAITPPPDSMGRQSWRMIPDA